MFPFSCVSGNAEGGLRDRRLRCRIIDLIGIPAGRLS
jgi:hypothetical protein